VVRSCHGHEGDPTASPCDAENFRVFVNECGPILKAQNKRLTMALPCDPLKYNDYQAAQNPGELDLDGMIANIDWIDLMAYDMQGAWSQLTGHHAGLYPNGDEDLYITSYPESEFNIDNCVQGYVDNGVPAEKLAIGVPFYGHS
jgi:chitinase